MNSYLSYFLGLFTVIAIFIAFYSLSKTDTSVESAYNKFLCKNISN